LSAGIGPGGKPGDDIELSEEFADDLVGIVFGAELSSWPMTFTSACSTSSIARSE
jgi:hypothetical protein